MAEPIGITFAPTQAHAGTMGRKPGAARLDPQAIRVLSLHVPRVLGASSLSPLVGRPRLTGGAEVAAVVRSVLQAMGQDISGMGGGPSPPGRPEVPGVTAPPMAPPMARPMAPPGLPSVLRAEPQQFAAQLAQTVGGFGGGGSAPPPNVIPGLQVPGGTPPPMPGPAGPPLPPPIQTRDPVARPAPPGAPPRLPVPPIEFPVPGLPPFDPGPSPPDWLPPPNAPSPLTRARNPRFEDKYAFEQQSFLPDILGGGFGGRY